MNTERRQQQRRRADVHPCEALHIAGRHLLSVGGSDRQIIDGQLVEFTARVVTAEELEAERHERASE